MSARRLSICAAAVLCAVLCQILVGSASADKLPDKRVYERVSSLAQYGSEVYQPEVELYSTEIYEDPVSSTELLFQSSADGNRVAYIGSPSVGGNELSGEWGGNQYLATRSASGGWTQANISPTYVSSSSFQAFSSDLSVGFLDAVEPLTSSAPGFGEEIPRYGNYDVLYSTSTATSEYLPQFSIKPPYRSIQSFKTAGSVLKPVFNYHSGGGREGRILAFAGASADASHVLFMANDALTGASEGRPAAEGGAGSTFEGEDNLYDSVGGKPRLVNILPDGTTHANAVFGGGTRETFGGGVRFSHVISSDGSRVFWTDLTSGHIYVRENDASTTEISSAGQYQTASSNGSDVFYTNGDLYEYEVENGHTIDLSPGVPVEKVVGASEDGKYVYYVTAGGEFKLWNDGATTTVAASRVTRAEVTPDGHSVVFFTEPIEVFGHINVYDADTGLVYCASCAGGSGNGSLPLTNRYNVQQPRWISVDGSRVFFITAKALVPQDTNGRVDVYEWERPDAGECPSSESEGCVYLLSGGTSIQESWFAEASENGNDVFIITRAKLVTADEDDLYDLYDVRVNGTIPSLPPTCTGTGCQGFPGAPPIFATPSSATFEGVGNFPLSQESKVKPKPKPKKKAKPKKKSKHKKKQSKVKRSAHKAAGRGRSSKGARS